MQPGGAQEHDLWPLTLFIAMWPTADKPAILLEKRDNVLWKEMDVGLSFTTHEV